MKHVRGVLCVKIENKSGRMTQSQEIFQFNTQTITKNSTMMISRRVKQFHNQPDPISKNSLFFQENFYDFLL